ncbi:hypothetical protein E2320_004516 [Naja naja]|nr:hypothetical protein E2320_004516 [Naja naja]
MLSLQTALEDAQAVKSSSRSIDEIQKSNSLQMARRGATIHRKETELQEDTEEDNDNKDNVHKVKSSQKGS